MQCNHDKMRILLILLPLALQPTKGFGLSNNVLPFFPYLPPTLSIFSLPALEDLFLLPLPIFSWVFPFFFFFFSSFHWHYSPLWALACRTMSFHFFPICHQLSPSSHSQHLMLSFCFLFPSFLGSSPSSRPFRFLSEDLFGRPILLHSL